MIIRGYHFRLNIVNKTNSNSTPNSQIQLHVIKFNSTWQIQIGNTQNQVITNKFTAKDCQNHFKISDKNSH